MTDRPTVVAIRLSAARLQKHVRVAARDSSRVVFREPPDRRNLAGELTYRQVLRCLQEGQLIGKPIMDNAFWQFQMRRHAAGLTVTVEAAALAAGARVEQIIVLGFDAE